MFPRLYLAHAYAGCVKAGLLFTLLFTCWLAGVPGCRAQVGQAQPVPDGAVRINIKTDLADSLLFERVVTLLQADGFSGNFRTEKNRIVTDDRTIDAANWTARIVAVLTNGTVQLQTEGTNRTANPPITRVRLMYSEKADKAAKAGFARLDAFARHLATSIPGAVLTYQVLP